MRDCAMADFPLLRRELDAAIPEGLYRYKKSTTDSERNFYLLLANGLADDQATAAAVTVKLIEYTIGAQGIDGPFRFATIATDGHRMVAIRYSSDRLSPNLFYRSRY